MFSSVEYHLVLAECPLVSRDGPRPQDSRQERSDLVAICKASLRRSRPELRASIGAFTTPLIESAR
jgi:hypothetical protein